MRDSACTLTSLAVSSNLVSPVDWRLREGGRSVLKRAMSARQAWRCIGQRRCAERAFAGEGKGKKGRARAGTASSERATVALALVGEASVEAALERAHARERDGVLEEEVSPGAWAGRTT